MSARNAQLRVLLALALLFLSTTTTASGVNAQSASAEQNSMVLEYPAVLRQHDAGFVELTLPPLTGGAALFEANNVMAVARLELTGMDSEGSEIHQPVGVNRGADFRWKVRAARPGQFRGTVWLHLELAPKGGGEVEEIVLLASPVEIQVAQVMGLSAPAARVLSAVGLMAGLLFAAPLLRKAKNGPQDAALHKPQGGGPPL